MFEHYNTQPLSRCATRSTLAFYIFSSFILAAFLFFIIPTAHAQVAAVPTLPDAPATQTSNGEAFKARLQEVAQLLENTAFDSNVLGTTEAGLTEVPQLLALIQSNVDSAEIETSETVRQAQHDAMYRAFLQAVENLALARTALQNNTRLDIQAQVAPQQDTLHQAIAILDRVARQTRFDEVGDTPTAEQPTEDGDQDGVLDNRDNCLSTKRGPSRQRWRWSRGRM